MATLRVSDDGTRDYARIAHDYARWAARGGGGKVCKWVRLAAQRYLDDRKRWRKKSSPYQWSPAHVHDVCAFIEALPHVEGEWDTATIRLEPVQIFILSQVFGWRRSKDGKRRFASVYIEMARKGAKSTLTAGVALYCLTCEDELGPQILVGATTGAQADKVFLPAKRMVERTPALREYFDLEAWARSVTCRANGGYIQPINSKSSTQDGHNPHVGILDELHAHKDRGLYDVIKSAFGARKNPLLWVITTAGYNLDGVCYEQRTLVTKILDGIVEADHYFGIIFTLDEGDDELDPRVWVKANPMLGVTPTLESMESYAIEARESPESMFEFRTKRLNIWTTAKGAWINIERWKACDGPVDLDALRDVPCYAGLDLAAVSDINAFVLVWLTSGRLKIWPRLYLPEAAIERRARQAAVPYRAWVEQGCLIQTPGDVADYEFIECDIVEALERFDIKGIGFDPWNAYDLTNRLMNAGAPMIEYRQGPKSYNEPMRELERHIRAGTLDHGGHPVLAWMASNLVARRDANENMAPDRKNSQDKIDGIVAALMGLGLALVDREDDNTIGSDYELMVL